MDGYEWMIMMKNIDFFSFGLDLKMKFSSSVRLDTFAYSYRKKVKDFVKKKEESIMHKSSFSMEKMIFLFDDAIFSIFNGKCYAYNLNFYIEKTKLNERIYF